MSKITVKNINQKIKKPNKLMYSSICVLFSLIIAMIMVAMTGLSPLTYMADMIRSTLGSARSIGDLLGTLSWVIPAGLAMAVSFKVGIFNIGSAGQMFFSGSIAYIVGLKIGSAFGIFGIVILMMVAVIIGSIIGWFIGFLKVRFNVSEVISSIMLNWILFYVVLTFYQHGLMNQVLNKDVWLNQDWISSLFGNSTEVNIGILLSPILILGLLFLYKKTNFGFKQDIVGNNKSAADSLGIKKEKEYLKAIVLSGAISGFAGWIYFTGTNHAFYNPGQQINGIFYQGITVSLLGFNSFAGVVLSSILISIFLVGGSSADTYMNGLPISDLILGFMLVMLTISHFFITYQPNIFGKIKNWWSNDKEEKC